MRISQVLTLSFLRFRGFFSGGLLYLVVGGAIGIFAAGLLGGDVVVGDKGRVVLDLGLKIISFLGVILCVVLGAGELRHEIQEKSLYPLLAKPLSRMQLLAGKALGILAFVGVLMALMGCLLGVFLFSLGEGVGTSILKGLAAVMGEVCLMSALVVFFSSLTTPYLSGLFSLSLYVIGLFLHDVYIYGQKFGGPLEQKAAGLIYTVLPNFGVFHITGRLVQGAAPGWGEIGLILIYGIPYSIFLLMLAGVLFQRRDL
jgi:ABC-type transport system involved in multi-copper enzyme maturation permease subunit